MFAFVARLPQPLKALYLVFFAAFAAAFVTFFFHDEEVTSLTGGVLGVVAVLIGLTLVANVNGAADGLADAARSHPRWSSRPFPATPGFARLFGTGLLVVGVVFAGQAVAQLS
jgi:hypothetical protein